MPHRAGRAPAGESAAPSRRPCECSALSAAIFMSSPSSSHWPSPSSPSWSPAAREAREPWELSAAWEAPAARRRPARRASPLPPPPGRRGGRARPGSAAPSAAASPLVAASGKRSRCRRSTSSAARSCGPPAEPVEREGLPVVGVGRVAGLGEPLRDLGEEVGGPPIVAPVERLPRGPVDRVRGVALEPWLARTSPPARRLPLGRRRRAQRSRPSAPTRCRVPIAAASAKPSCIRYITALLASGPRPRARRCEAGASRCPAPCHHE